MSGSADSNASRGQATSEAGTIRVFSAVAALPAAAAALFASPDGGDLFTTGAWFACVIDAALPGGSVACFVVLSCNGFVRALIPLRASADGRPLEGLTSPYTCLYRPLLAPGLTSAEAAALGHAFGRFCRRSPMVRLDAMPAGVPHLDAFLAGTSRAGLLRAKFVHFGNWHETVADLSWPDYLERRPGAVRSTIRRKLARAERDPAVAFEILRTPGDTARGVAAYEAVYASSWKPAEPFPAFNATLIERTASLGLLRLGVLTMDGIPVAVQFWVVTGGVATVLKLAHDERAKAVSPGTVLTAMMLRHLLDGEHVRSIDFGRGDDPYKQGWVRERRVRVGVVLINPLRAAGLAFALRHIAARVVRPLLRRLRSS